MEHSNLDPFGAELRDERSQQGGTCWTGRLACTAKSVGEERDAQAWVLLEGSADRGDELMLGLADVECAEVDAGLGFGNFVLGLIRMLYNYRSCRMKRSNVNC